MLTPVSWLADDSVCCPHKANFVDTLQNQMAHPNVSDKVFKSL